MRFEASHLADVMVEDDDLIGDGVNVAARIQQAADPDAIDVSAALFEQIRLQLPFAFDDRGEQASQHRRAGPCLPPPREVNRFVYQIAPTRAAPAQPSYSLAVMPIETDSGHEDQRFLAEGITEELIFELGRFRKLFVTSRSATRSLAATATDPQSVGDRLGVRYALAGTIRQLGPQIRLGLTLAETETGVVVWVIE